jgi:hypothetical protein
MSVLLSYAKLAVGALVIAFAVGPISYGSYGEQGFWVGLAAGLTLFANLTVIKALVSRHEIIDFVDFVDLNLARAVLASVCLGVTFGFGTSLGLDLAEHIQVGFVTDAIAKVLLIGLAVGFLSSSLFEFGALRPSQNRSLVESLIIQFREHRLLGFIGYLAGLMVGALLIMSMLLGLPLALGEAFGGGSWSGVLGGLILGVLVGLTMRGLTRRRGADSAASVRDILPYALFVGTTFGAYIGFNETSAQGFRQALLVGIVGTIGATVAVLPGTLVGYLLRPMGKEVTPLTRYLWEMRWPVVLFAFSFMLIVVLFAGVYASVAHRDDEAFTNATPSSFSDHLYFSLMSATSLGEGEEIKAASALAKTLASVEVVIGFAWSAVVFAAVIAYLEPRFARIRTEENNKALVRQFIEDIVSKKDGSAPVSNVLAADHALYDDAHPQGLHDCGDIEQIAADIISPGLDESEVHYLYQTATNDRVTTRWVIRSTSQTNSSETETPHGDLHISSIDQISDGKITATWIARTEHKPVSEPLLTYTTYAYIEGDFYTLREAALILDKTSKEIRQMISTNQLRDERHGPRAEHYGLRLRIPTRDVYAQLIPETLKDSYTARVLQSDQESPETLDEVKQLKAALETLQQQVKLAELQAGKMQKIESEAREERTRLLRRLDEESIERRRLQYQLETARKSWWKRTFGK